MGWPPCASETPAAAASRTGSRCAAGGAGPSARSTPTGHRRSRTGDLVLKVGSAVLREDIAVAVQLDDEHFGPAAGRAPHRLADEVGLHRVDQAGDADDVDVVRGSAAF